MPDNKVTPLGFTYKNHRGEIAERRVIPLRVYYGTSGFHPEPQWLLDAFDLDKGEIRTFAMQNMQPRALTSFEAAKSIVEKTLLWLMGTYAETGPEISDLQECLKDVRSASTDDGCCQLCSEIECYIDCPLGEFRSVDSKRDMNPRGLTYRTKDHPEANGQKPIPGQLKWVVTFPLENGTTLTVEMGRRGLEALLEMLQREKSETACDV